MKSSSVSPGVAHDVPPDLKKALLSDDLVLERWEDLTPLARNEWICWAITVKQSATRKKHVERTVEDLKNGKRRPCCWSGCIHRTDKPMNATQKWLLNKSR